MKKIFLIFLSFIILSLCGCGCRSKEAANNSAGSTMSETSLSSTITSYSAIASDTPPVSRTEEQTTATETEEHGDEEAYENPITATAERLIGIPYLFGGESPEGFDNSGFIYYVLRENGYISCPRLISEQTEWAQEVGYSEIRSGDVLYFSSEPGGIAEFGGIYAGGGVMIYCPSPGKSVMKTDIRGEYWKSRFVTAISL